MRYIQNSPYAEVRAVVDNHDDPNMPASTFRSWLIGTLFVAGAGFINQFFSIQYFGIVVGPDVAQFLCVPPSLIPTSSNLRLIVDSGFPVGKFLEKVLPTRRFTTFGYTWSLNPGKFNMKEHMVITIMANVGFFGPYTSYVSAPGDCNYFGPLLIPDALACLCTISPHLLQSAMGQQLRLSAWV
jgi:hypothetical protein